MISHLQLRVSPQAVQREPFTVARISPFSHVEECGDAEQRASLEKEITTTFDSLVSLGKGVGLDIGE